MAAPATYDPKLVTASFFGIKITGYMKGTFITVKRSAEKWSFENGSQGNGVYIMSADDSAIAEFTLQATSPSNRDLSNKYKADKKDKSGIGPISIEDLNTDQTLFSGAFARIITCPDFERADSLSPCVWRIHIAQLDNEFIDGNG